MTASTITSIKDYIQLKKTATGSSEPIRRIAKDMDWSSDRSEKNNRLKNDIPENIRLGQPIIRHHHVGLRLTLQNRLALNTRRTDQTMRQISIQISLIKDGLYAMAKRNSPYPTDSGNRTADFQTDSTRPMRIDQLTLSASPDDNNAPDEQINMSIQRLKEAERFHWEPTPSVKI